MGEGLKRRKGRRKMHLSLKQKTFQDHLCNILVSVFSTHFKFITFCSFNPFTISDLIWIFHQFQEKHYAKVPGLKDKSLTRCHTTSLPIPENKEQAKHTHVSSHTIEFSAIFWKNTLDFPYCKWLKYYIGRKILSLRK